MYISQLLHLHALSGILQRASPRTNRLTSTTVIFILFAFALTGCGGAGSGSTGGGGGGGGGGNGLSISTLAPSGAMTGIPVGLVLVLGQGFTSASQVLVNGQPINTLYTDSGTLEAQIDPSLKTMPGAYQFSVQNSGQVSNSLQYTVSA